MIYLLLCLRLLISLQLSQLARPSPLYLSSEDASRGNPRLALNDTRSITATNMTLSNIISLNANVRTFTYDLAGTDVAIDFIINLDEPLDHNGLGLAILDAKARLRHRLRQDGNDWLAQGDDPFVSDVPNLCLIRIDSSRSGTGRSRMTYKTMLSVMDALWNVMYLMRDGGEGVMKIQVAGIIAGHGAVVTTDPTKPTAAGHL